MIAIDDRPSGSNSSAALVIAALRIICLELRFRQVRLPEDRARHRGSVRLLPLVRRSVRHFIRTAIQLTRDGDRQVERRCEPAQKVLLRRAVRSVGIAHADCHFVGELPRGLRRQHCGKLYQIGFRDQGIAVEGRQIDPALRSEGVGDLLDRGALALVLRGRRRTRPSALSS
jgi:hypothetical protein